MSVSVSIVVAAVAAMTATGQSDTRQQSPVPTERAVMICSTDRATVRAFAREYGETPRFMTADDIQTARRTGERWTTPRCITRAEHLRLRQQASTGR